MSGTKILAAPFLLLTLGSDAFATEALAVTPEECVHSEALEDTRETAVLPKGVCPFPMTIGQTVQCYDRRHNLQVWNSCNIAVKIIVVAGKSSDSGNSTLGVGNNKRVFSCLESNSECKEVTIKVIGFSGKPIDLPGIHSNGD